MSPGFRSSSVFRESAGGGVARLAGQVLVFHLPRMIHVVEGGVADEEGQCPRSHRPLCLATLVGAHRLEICGPVGRQGAGSEGAVLRDRQADLLREVLALDGQRRRRNTPSRPGAG